MFRLARTTPGVTRELQGRSICEPRSTATYATRERVSHMCDHARRALVLRRLPPTLAWLWVVSIAWSLALTRAQADALSSALFIRTDSDETLVVSPRAHLQSDIVSETTLDATYTADVWTSASVDIRASASLPVTEQRNELDVALQHEFSDLTLSGSYRYSVENDYLSHGVSAGSSLDLAENNSTIALHGYAYFDTVGRVGQPSFSKALNTIGLRTSLTQVLSASLLAQVTYEIGHLDGFQASPYRMVGFGGTGFGCQEAPLCRPEHVPDLRTRHAAAILLRYALTDSWSIGGNYRFYLDDWHLSSHMLLADVGWMLGDFSRLSLRYRFYVQSGVSFYQSVYREPPPPGAYTTRDREQSPMHDHHVGLEWEQMFPVDEHAGHFALRASVGAGKYVYNRFVGLKSVNALELTFALSLER